MKNNIYHVISNTHWDREWRFPFQRNRQMLVDMIDAVLDILEKEPQYKAFHLDSQSIVLKDYLEIKPQNKNRIIKLAQEKRLLHGPWYILPEEFQVGGENLIRNLLIGHKTSKKYGGVSKIGYSPFSWGQISQLPQLYKEFNINLIMFYRGINSIDSPKAEFLWIGADGTNMVSSRFSTMPRYNFYFYIYRPVIHNEGFYDVEYKWERGGIPFHFADSEQQTEDYFLIDPADGYYPENIEKMVNAIIENQANDFTTPHKIWMEGHDSSGPNVKTVRILNDIRKLMPEVNVQHSTLEEYAQHIADSVDVNSLYKVFGERRSAQNNNRCGNLFGYTTSARMYLKQANFNAERWIQYYAEPFNVFSGFLGRDIADQYPHTIWELIVQNSAHDSIGGCSLDRIHEDMMIRYAHAVEISKGLFERAAKHLVKQLNTSNFKEAVPEAEKNIFISLANPTNYTRTDLVLLHIDIPVSLDKGNLQILDKNGNTIEIQIVSRKPHQPVLEQMINRPMFFDMVRYEVYIRPSNISAFSLTAYQVKPSDEPLVINTQVTNERILENEHIKVTVNNDGSLNIFDKNLNYTWNNTAWFYDEGDAGHAWVLKPVGEKVSTLNTTPHISQNTQGNLVSEITITHKLLLAENLKARETGTGTKLENIIQLTVSLHKGETLVRFNVTVENKSESHRLRMMFPAQFTDGFSYGEGQFDVVKRSLDRPDTTDWMEQPMYDFPMHHFVDMTNGSEGMAIITDGLKEYEVLPDTNNTVAITLLRTFEYKINPSAPQDYSYEKGAQMLGKHNYRLAMYPHKQNWQSGNVFAMAFKFNYAMRAIQTGMLKGAAGHQLNLLKIENENIIFSALKKAENDEPGICYLRVYNPCNEQISTTIYLGIKPEKAWMSTLEELEKDPLTITENGINFTAEPLKIITIGIKYENF